MMTVTEYSPPAWITECLNTTWTHCQYFSQAVSGEDQDFWVVWDNQRTWQPPVHIPPAGRWQRLVWTRLSCQPLSPSHLPGPGPWRWCSVNKGIWVRRCDPCPWKLTNVVWGQGVCVTNEWWRRGMLWELRGLSWHFGIWDRMSHRETNQQRFEWGLPLLWGQSWGSSN